MNTLRDPAFLLSSVQLEQTAFGGAALRSLLNERWCPSCKCNHTPKSCSASSALAAAAAAAEPAPGNDSPCTHGRSVPVTDLSNGRAQYCIVLCRVAVVTGGQH